MTVMTTDELMQAWLERGWLRTKDDGKIGIASSGLHETAKYLRAVAAILGTELEDEAAVLRGAAMVLDMCREGLDGELSRYRFIGEDGSLGYRKGRIYRERKEGG